MQDLYRFGRKRMFICQTESAPEKSAKNKVPPGGDTLFSENKDYGS